MTSPRAAEPVFEAIRKGDYRLAADRAFRLLHGGDGAMSGSNRVRFVGPVLKTGNAQDS